MKLHITKEQAKALTGAVGMARNEDYPDSDPYNKQYQRLREKLEKLLEAESECPHGHGWKKRKCVYCNAK